MVDPGEFILTARRRHGITQAQLALRAGTTQGAVSRIERGTQSPSFATVERLLLAMGEVAGVASIPLPCDHDPVHLAAERRLQPSARLERAFAWTRFNDELRAAGRQAGGDR